MSEALLKKSLDFIEQEDGITLKKKKKVTKTERQREHLLKVLKAAEKGKVQLPEEESYLARSAASSSSQNDLDTRLAEQGYSLIEQMRDAKPADLGKRNLKYIKFLNKNGLKDTTTGTIMKGTSTTKARSGIVRKERAKITGLREERKKKKKTSGSVFSADDFADLYRIKRVKAVDEDTLY